MNPTVRTTITPRNAQTTNRHRVNMWCELLLAILDNRPVTLLERTTRPQITRQPADQPQLRLL